jgi:hypothetical protein
MGLGLLRTRGIAPLLSRTLPNAASVREEDVPRWYNDSAAAHLDQVAAKMLV